jgi:hypothetical protein
VTERLVNSLYWRFLGVVSDSLGVFARISGG